MPFSILLAHFCDKHGPRSILTTEEATDAPDQYILSDFSKESYCTSCLLLFPKSLTNPSHQTTTIQTEVDNELYTTTQYSGVKFRQLNSIVRKCLSEETSVYDGSPMYFGDETRRYSISQSFKLKDLEARGSERRYAFIVNCDDEKLMLQHWGLIVDNLTAMIKYLIERSKEQEIKSSRNNEIYLRGKNIQSKSMTELLGDDELFVKIHLWNTRLLKKLSKNDQ